MLKLYRKELWVIKMADEEDPFESLLFLEERCHKDGYAEGWTQGSKKGLTTGQMLGIEKGKELASEIGFYDGFITTWLLLVQNVDKSEKKNSRVVSLLKNLQGLISQLPLTDPTNEDLFTDVEKVRAKFKQVCSLLGVNPDRSQDSGEQMLSF